jgi:ABC-2 type transport system permease protein
VVYGFQSIDSMLAGLEAPAQLTLYVTKNSLPADLAEAPQIVAEAAQEIGEKANGMFTYTEVDPDMPDSEVTRQTLQEQYGLQPFPVSLFSTEDYYLHMVLAVGDETQVFYVGNDLSRAGVRSAIESVLKRQSSGFLRTVGLWTPAPTMTNNMFGQPQQSPSSYTMIGQQLGDQYNVRAVDLSGGQAPTDVDVLVLIAPQTMTDKERFAIDQYLMQGGSVVVAAGNYIVSPDQMTGALGIQPVDNGLRDLLQHYGVDVQQSLVMDPQNEPFPVTVNRQVQGFQVQELQAIPYPFFVDVRPDNMDRQNPVSSNLAAVTLSWVSPVVLDEAKNAGRNTSVLLKSSEGSWLRTDTNIQPDLQLYPDYGFPVEGEQKSYPLAVSIQGRFDSFFADKPSPWTTEAEPDQEAASPTVQPTADASTQPPAVIENSPDTARLLVVGSAEFVDDLVLQISSSLGGQRYLNNLLFMQNAVDWSVEDLDLLTIRARGDNVRVLEPLSQQQESGWEIANYAVALLSLLGVAFVWRWRRRHEKPLALKQPAVPAGLSVEPGD